MHEAFICLLIYLISFSLTEGETKSNNPLSCPGGKIVGEERSPRINRLREGPAFQRAFEKLFVQTGSFPAFAFLLPRLGASQ